MKNTKSHWNFVTYLLEGEPSGINRKNGNRLMYAAVEVTERSQVLTYTPGFYEIDLRLNDLVVQAESKWEQLDRNWLCWTESTVFRPTMHIKQGLIDRYITLFAALRAIESTIRRPICERRVDQMKAVFERTRDPLRYIKRRG